jgi:hypothetical protein
MGSEISDDYAYLLGALRDACVYLPEYDKVLQIGMRRGKMYEFCLEVCRSPTTNLIRFLNFIPLQHPETVLRAPREFRRA